MLQRRGSLRLPFSRHPPRFPYLRRRKTQSRNRIAQVAVAHLIVPGSLRRGQIEPHPGRHAVLWYADTPHITHAHLRLPRRIAAVRCLVEPEGGLGVVLLNSLALGIEDSKQSLGIAITLFGRLPRPFKGSAVIFRQTLAFMMHTPEIVLSRGIPTARERQEILTGPGVIAFEKSPLSGMKTGMNYFHRDNNSVLVTSCGSDRFYQVLQLQRLHRPAMESRPASRLRIGAGVFIDQFQPLAGEK
jgi:hypothetical protein